MRLLVALFLIFTWIAPADAQRIATIIGNSNYETDGWRLVNPANDVVLLHAALTEIGFDVTVHTDLDEDAMEDAFIDHGKRLKAAGADSVGFFFYAGHAVSSQGLNYLIPVDAEIYSEADVWAQAPRLGLLFQALEDADNGTNFIVLDACRDNQLPRTSRSTARGLTSAERIRGTLIAYSTAPGNTAEDGAGGNSPFATALSEYLVRPGIPAEGMFRRVASVVEQRTSMRQQPWIESGLRGEADFCFAGCDSNASVGTGQSAEQASLAFALRENSPSVLNAFLRQYPESPSRSLVEARVKELERPDSPRSSPLPTSGKTEVSSTEEAMADLNEVFGRPRTPAAIIFPALGVVNRAGVNMSITSEIGVQKTHSLRLGESISLLGYSTDSEWYQVQHSRHGRGFIRVSDIAIQK